MNRPCPDEGQLVEYLAQTLPVAERDEVESHLDSCGSCRELVVAEVRAQHSEAASEPTSAAELLMRFEDRYLIGDVIGSGNMGAVYDARDRQLDRAVALKLVGENVEDPKAAERLVLEAKILARLSDPHVVAVYEVGLLHDQVAVAMEKVEGTNLRQWLAKGESHWRDVVAVIVQVAGGLASAHEAGVLHRDVKPSNIFVGDDGRVRIGDFGLATMSRRDDNAGDLGALAAGSPARSRTQAGGTPAYMAPEQGAGRALPASDQYSLGVTLFEALYGRRPETGAVQIPKRPAVPRQLRAAIKKALQADSAERFADMRAFGDALQASLNARHRKVLFAACLAVVACLAALFFLVGSGPDKATSVRAFSQSLAEGAWNDVVKSDLRLRIKGDQSSQGASYRAATAEQIENILDAYVEGWLAERHETWLAMSRGTISTERYDARLRCLDSRLRELKALVDSMAATEMSPSQAAKATHSLEPNKRCRNATQHASLDETQRAELERLERLSEKAKTAHRLRQTSQAKAAAMELATALAQSGDGAHLDRLRATSEYLMAHVESDARQYPAAEKRLRVGYELAKKAADPVLLADLSSALMHNVGAQQSRSKEALGMRSFVEADVAAANDTAMTARYLTRLSSVHAEAGDHQEALAASREALTNMRAAYGDTDIRLAAVHHNMGITYEMLRRPGDARAQMVRALELTEKTLGQENPTFATIERGLSLLAYRQGKLAEAKEHAARSLEIRQRVFGRDHPSIAGNLDVLAAIAKEEGDWAAAKTHFERARELRAKALEPTHPRMIAASINVSLALRKLGHIEEAEDTIRSALGTLEAQYGSDDYRLNRALLALGQLYEFGKGEPEAALAIYRRIHKISSAKFGPDAKQTIEALMAVALVLVEQRRYREALPILERCLPLRIAALEPPYRIAITKWNLAVSLVELGRQRRRATKLAAEALAVLRKDEVHAALAGELEAWMRHAKIGP